MAGVEEPYQAEEEVVVAAIAAAEQMESSTAAVVVEWADTEAEPNTKTAGAGNTGCSTDPTPDDEQEQNTGAA